MSRGRLSLVLICNTLRAPFINSEAELEGCEMRTICALIGER